MWLQRLSLTCSLVFGSLLAPLVFAATFTNTGQFAGGYDGFVAYDNDTLALLKGKGGIEFFRRNGDGEYEFVSRVDHSFSSHCANGVSFQHYLISSCGVFDTSDLHAPVYVGPGAMHIKHIIDGSIIAIDSMFVRPGKEQYKISLYSLADMLEDRSSFPQPFKTVVFESDWSSRKFSSEVFGNHLLINNTVFDVTDASNPKLLGAMAIDGHYYTRAGDALVTNGSVYLLDDVLSPKKVSSLNLSSHSLKSIRSHGTRSCFNFYSGTKCYELSDPANPVELGAMSGVFLDVAMIDNTLILRDGTGLAMWKRDNVSGDFNRYHHLDSVRGAADISTYNGEILHLTEWGGLALKTVDENFRLTTIARLHPARTQQSIKMKRKDEMVYVLGFGGATQNRFTISAINVGGSDHLTQLGHLVGDFLDFDVDGKVLFSVNASKLVAIDFTDASHPSLISEFNIGGTDIVYALGKVYIKSATGIALVNVEDPHAMHIAEDELTRELNAKNIGHFSKVGPYIVAQSRVNDFESEFYVFGLNGHLGGKTSRYRDIRSIGSAFLAGDQIVLSGREGLYVSIDLNSMQLSKVDLRNYRYGAGGYGKMALLDGHTVIEGSSNGVRFFHVD